MPVASTSTPGPGTLPRSMSAKQARDARQPKQSREYPVSRRSGRGAQDGAQADIEVAATTTAIAGLRRRLRRPGTVEHPAVRRELRKLEEQLVSLFEQAGRNPGRHRSPGHQGER
jgi:hypothetical protein